MNNYISHYTPTQANRTSAPPRRHVDDNFEFPRGDPSSYATQLRASAILSSWEQQAIQALSGGNTLNSVRLQQLRAIAGRKDEKEHPIDSSDVRRKKLGAVGAKQPDTLPLSD